MESVIVLPTYNERENIPAVLDKLTKYDIKILVVDDNSPDGTGRFVKEYREKNPKVFLLERERKEGLGKAYIAGFKYALEKLDADIVFQMDSDMSHNPEDVPRFLEAIRENDVVIGSRYVKGGGIENWNWHRKLTSRIGNLLARFAAGLNPIEDCTTGYRAIRTDVLKKTGFEKIDAQGYAFLTTLLYELKKNGARIKEIPITFIDRKHGRSKLGKKEMAEFLLNSFRLRFK